MTIFDLKGTFEAEVEAPDGEEAMDLAFRRLNIIGVTDIGFTGIAPLTAEGDGPPMTEIPLIPWYTRHTLVADWDFWQVWQVGEEEGVCICDFATEENANRIVQDHNERIPAQNAFRDVLDALGALGGSWHELIGHGFTAERAKEIVALARKL